ncbi:VOC family protein [Aliivibrio fischeri]|uniref:VOC family protein n=1 Tax=Aliivibrio fischeri TaxID=668 RepID=A0A510UMY7_ALIFS|nr:VOC family protein [Aliivibrio fischeri]MUK51025.1 VOC family protein [Aliivibrio fischeri]GEK15984.1 hypothetical protein AFI02nite_40200 [Aliivibrio fischeri]
MLTRSSHVLIWVKNIHKAVADFRQLGFTVEYVTTEKKSKNALIWFEQGAIIELLTSPPNPQRFKWMIDLFAGRGAGKRMIRWSQQGEGFCDLAVVSDDFDNDLLALKVSGIKMCRTIPWRRTKPNGDKTKFHFVYPRTDSLPFIISPYQPSQRPDKVDHSNGATSLAKINMTVRKEDWDTVWMLLGQDPVMNLEYGPKTQIQNIELAGLNNSLPTEKLHGTQLNQQFSK